MITEFLIFFASLCFIVHLYTSWNDMYWLKQKIPFVEPHKFFGNIRDVVLMRKSIGQVYRKIYTQLGDKPLGGFFKFRQPILMVKHPDLIQKVLVDQFDDFSSNDIHVRRDASPILKMNPILASGATWRSMKSIWSPLNSATTLSGILTIVKSSSTDMIEYIRQKKDNKVEGKELARKFISDVLASSSLGYEANSFQNVDSPFRLMSDHILKTDFKSNAALMFALYAPNVANWVRFRIISKKFTAYFIDLISKICQHRVQNGIKRKDFLEHLICINKESEASGEGTVYNYNKITGHCMTLFLNGYFMTTSSLYFCLNEIAAHPEVQEKIETELKSKIETNDWTLERINSLEYLEMVVKESLRLHPPIQSITRLCTNSTVLQHDKYTYPVKIGTPVTVPVLAIHTDPNYYNAPYNFDPERFSGGAEIYKNVYIPFGAGPRTCPGEQYGKLILKVAIISLILNFEISTETKHLQSDPMSCLLNAAKGDVELTFSPKIEKKERLTQQ